MRRIVPLAPHAMCACLPACLPACQVDDPAAVMPDDWDVEEDGEWEPPKVPNPKCEEAPGCGEWKKPMKKNPAFKGKWHAPMIDNPAYKGVWKPREVPNPDFFDLERPRIEPVEAVAVEIWTMSVSEAG